MEKITGNIVDDKLIEYNGLIITNYDLELCIDNYIATLYKPDDIYNKSTKAFNGLLLYLYNHLIKYILPGTYNNDYELLDDIFRNIYINISYRFNRTCSVNLFCILVGLDYSFFYDIKTGTYRANNGIVNNKHKQIIQNWINYCNSELIEDVVTTNGIGSMFRAKVHGFREDNTNQITINVNVPQISESQLQNIAMSSTPELPTNDG